MNTNLEFTTEMMKVLSGRINEHCHARFGSMPDRIQIEEDGTIRVTWFSTHPYSCESDNDEEWIKIEDLKSDLDELAAKRQEELKLKAKKDEEYRKQLEVQRKKEEKEQRRIQYNQLKKEFE